MKIAFLVYHDIIALDLCGPVYKILASIEETGRMFHEIYADKGYLSKALWEMLFADGMQLITNVRKNMKGHIMELKDRLLLRKRAIIETINDELKNLCQIEYTGHRSVNTFIMNILSALVAYCFFQKKTSLNIEEVKTNQLF